MPLASDALAHRQPGVLHARKAGARWASSAVTGRAASPCRQVSRFSRNAVTLDRYRRSDAESPSPQRAMPPRVEARLRDSVCRTASRWTWVRLEAGGITGGARRTGSIDTVAPLAVA